VDEWEQFFRKKSMRRAREDRNLGVAIVIAFALAVGVLALSLVGSELFAEGWPQ
jgi:hypothetical protein